MSDFISGTWAVLQRELRRIVAQPIYIVLMAVLPLVSFVFFAALFEKGIARNIPIAVVDNDHSDLSRTLVRMIGETPTAMVSYEAQDMYEAERLMREGRIGAVVLIPSDFAKNILNNRQTNVDAYVTGSNITVNGLLSKDIQTAVTTFSAGIQIQLLTKQGLTERQAMAQLMPVRFMKHILFNPYINYGYYLSSGFMPMMLLIFTIMATIFTIGVELKRSTAGEWFATARGSVMAAVTGKLLPVMTVMFVVSVAMYVIMFNIVGMPLNGSMAMLLVGSLLFVMSYQAIGVLIVAVLANMRLALSIGGGYSVLAFTFSGLTFPIMAMSPFMQGVSRLFPFTYYTDLILDQALRGAPAIYSVPDLCYISLFILLSLLSLPRLRRICTQEKYWGKL